jgi:hypothetical protein
MSGKSVRCRNCPGCRASKPIQERHSKVPQKRHGRSSLADMVDTDSALSFTLSVEAPESRTPHNETQGWRSRVGVRTINPPRSVSSPAPPSMARFFSPSVSNVSRAHALHRRFPPSTSSAVWAAGVATLPFGSLPVPSWCWYKTGPSSSGQWRGPDTGHILYTRPYRYVI